ncbi:MAG: hypothetical protein JO129_04680 [Candidatus Dependentiae bacterium]|nr:hypothetical protein [Candidatus Dependentiae bacterium]
MMKRVMLLMLSFYFTDVLYASSPGTFDTSFGVNGIEKVSAQVVATSSAFQDSAVQPDGYIVSVGYTNSGNIGIVARFTPNGAVDSSHFNAPSGYINLTSLLGEGCNPFAVAIQDNGCIVIAGDVDIAATQYFFVMRLLPTGQLDTVANGGTGFGDTVEGVQIGYTIQQINAAATIVYGITIQPADQKIVITGTTGANAFTARLTTSGVLDTSTAGGNVPFVSGVGYAVFNPNPSSDTIISRAVAIDNNRKILITGSVAITGFSAPLFAARYLTDGTLDLSFNFMGYFISDPNTVISGGVYVSYDIGFQKIGANAGKIIIAGTDGTNALVLRYNLDGSQDVDFGNYNEAFITTFGGKTAVGAHSLVINDNDEIVIGGSLINSGVSNAFCAQILADGSNFDTSFASPNGYTILSTISGLTTPAITGNSLIMQQNGKYILSGGALSSTSTIPYYFVARYVGDAVPQGCMDASIDLDSGFISGLGNVVSLCTLPNNSIICAAQSGSNSTLTQFSSTGTQLANYSLGISGIKNIIVDPQGRIVACGGNGTHGWLARFILAAGSFSLDPSFNGGAIIIDAHGIATYNQIVLDTVGNILVMGQAVSPNQAELIKYNSSGLFQNLIFSIPGYLFTDILIGASNNIFIATTNPGYNLLLYYGTEQSINLTPIDTGLSAITYQNAYVSFDTLGNIYLATINTTNGDIVIQKYTNNLGTPVYLTTLTIHQTTTLLTNPVLTDLQCDINNQLLFTGYDQNFFVVGRINNTFTGLDYSNITVAASTSSFAPNATVPGLLKSMFLTSDPTPLFSASPARVSNAVVISPNGEIIFGGYEAQNGSGNIVGVVGFAVGSYGPIPVVTLGDFDPTYGVDGLTATYANGASSPTADQQVKAIVQLNSSNLMTVIDNGVNSWTVRILPDGTNDSTYGNGQGIAIAQLPGNESVTNMIVDGAGNYLVIGTSASNGGYLKQILPSGAMDTTFGGHSGAPIGTVYGLISHPIALGELSNGNIVIVGSNNGVGTIQIINPFGVSLFSLFDTTNITSVSVDASNNIYVPVINGTNTISILKITASGSPVTSFGINGTVTIVASQGIANTSDIKLGLDNSGNINIAWGSTTPGQFTMTRLLPNGSIDTTFNSGAQLQIEVSASATALANIINVVPLQNNKILIGGYIQDNITVTNNEEFVAAITAVGTLDTNFDPTDVIPGMNKFQVISPANSQLSRILYGLQVQTNGQIIVAGAESPAAGQANPFTGRLIGYPNDQAVAQYPGYIPPFPSPLNTAFNGGISEVADISHLIAIGNVAVDHVGKSIVGGIVSTNNGATGQFVVAHYTTTGLLDATFGTGGIVVIANIFSGLRGGYIAVDTVNNIYIAGVTNTHEFVIARLTSAGILDHTFGIGGIVTSAVITNLSTGGFVTVDALTNQPLLGGYTAHGDLVATRYLLNGSIDTSFAAGSSNVALVPVPLLISGGSITTDSTSNVFIGGLTSLNTMVIVKLNNAGVLVTSFGSLGIASTNQLPANNPGLFGGGSIALDSIGNIVVGGLANTQAFVVARFLPTGNLDTNFGSTGIAYSSSVSQLQTFGTITVDSNNNIVVGGVANTSMIVARFVGTGSNAGTLDTSFTSTGMATTGAIIGLMNGGSVAVDVYDNIFSGGLTNAPGFVISQMYSGEEIFVTNTSMLSPSDLRSYYYGNDPIYLDEVFSPQYYIQFITDPAAKLAVLAEVASLIASYELIYSNVPGWNLVWHLYRARNSFEIARIALIAEFASSTSQINRVFAQFYARMDAMKFSSSSFATIK